MNKKTAIPKFRSEAEEAQWWYDHRGDTAQFMEEGVTKGRTITLSRILERAKQRSGVTPTVSIRIDPADLSRARLFASRNGLRYQTYLKMLLHEALEKEGRRRSG
jgi:hypothetical protein